MPKDKAKTIATEINPDYVRMYYEHQYDRIKKYEELALAISNIVITISALIFTFGFNNKQLLGSIFVLFLPVVIIIANISAILYINDSGKWIQSHRIRAKRVLEMYMPELFHLDSEAIAAPLKRSVSRKRFQNLIHILFIALAVILIILFTLQMFGVAII